MKNFRPVDSAIVVFITLIKQLLPLKSEGNTDYFPMLNVHRTERKGAGLSYANQGPFFSIIIQLQFCYQFFKQREKSLITKILKIQKTASKTFKCQVFWKGEKRKEEEIVEIPRLPVENENQLFSISDVQAVVY